MDYYMEEGFWGKYVDLEDKSFEKMDIEGMKDKPLLNHAAFNMLFREILASCKVDTRRYALNFQTEDNGLKFMYQDEDDKIGTFYISFNSIDIRGNVDKERLFKDNIKFIFKEKRKEGYRCSQDEVSHISILSKYWDDEPSLKKTIKKFNKYIKNTDENKIINFIETHTKPSILKKVIRRLKSKKQN